MSEVDSEKLLAAGISIAYAAGALIRERLPKPREVSTKANAVDLVTDTDHAVDALIRERLRATFPAHAYLTEEAGASAAATAAEVCWVVDPLDGTVNFAHGVPHFAVSIAAVRGFDPENMSAATAAGETLAGIVYDPMRDEMYTATSAGPARLNQESLAVSTQTSLDQALVATGFPYDRRERADEYLADWHRILPLCRDLRRAGAAALDLVWVAAGRVDAYWERGLHPWDIAAGALIARRAGATATDFSGRDLFLDAQEILVAPARVHMELQILLREGNHQNS